MSQLVLTDVVDGVMTVTLNRPERKNALSQEAYGGLADAIERAEKDDGVRVVVLQSEGDVFCAGADIGDFAAANKGGAPRGPRNSTRWIQGLGRIEKPVIVAVQGAAVGIGTTMLMHCDLICMAEEGSLRTPFVNLALVPEAASSLQLPERIGHVRAFSMFVLGEAVDAAKAVSWGIANEIVPAGELRARARAAAEAVAGRPPSAVQITKALMRDPARLAARIEEEGRHFSAQLKTAEAREAFAAFREKRAPDFGKLG